MNKWKNLITGFHAADHPEAPDSLVLGEPAAPGDIAALEEQLGLRFPAEFRELYQTFNGFGRRDGAEVIWFFVPIGEIADLTEHVCKWFKGTHPELAAQFVAFVDWESGDYTGYLFDEAGDALEGLFDFEHEAYDFESRQDPDEFLIPMFPSLEEFLAPA